MSRRHSHRHCAVKRAKIMRAGNGVVTHDYVVNAGGQHD
jgi:hypothetical protein